MEEVEKKKESFCGYLGCTKVNLQFGNIMLFIPTACSEQEELKKWMYSGVFSMLSCNGMQNQLFLLFI